MSKNKKNWSSIRNIAALSSFKEKFPDYLYLRRNYQILPVHGGPGKKLHQYLRQRATYIITMRISTKERDANTHLNAKQKETNDGSKREIGLYPVFMNIIYQIQ